VQFSDEEREQFYQQLSARAAADQITLEELERRVAVVAEAENREQAAAVLADLPPLSGEASPRRRRLGRRYGDADAPAPDWQPTAERFRDPGSGRVMRVWVDGAGGRHYVADKDG
jgi:hypothetical protein